jgi:hypothetical protein
MLGFPSLRITAAGSTAWKEHLQQTGFEQTNVQCNGGYACMGSSSDSYGTATAAATPAYRISSYKCTVVGQTNCICCHTEHLLLWRKCSQIINSAVQHHAAQPKPWLQSFHLASYGLSQPGHDH